MGANAQTSVPLFTAGEVLTAANQNISAGTGVPVFATTTTRDAAFGGTGEKVLAEGQTCYIEAAPNRLQIYDGATWRPIDLDSWTAYTPTVSSITGTITTASASGSYAVVGKIVFVRFVVSITTNGTGGTAVAFSLPFTTAAGYSGSQQVVGGAREAGVSGSFCQVTVSNSSNSALIWTFNNGYPGANGASMNGTIIYEMSA
jgi:hypothetical protein